LTNQILLFFYQKNIKKETFLGAPVCVNFFVRVYFLPCKSAGNNLLGTRIHIKPEIVMTLIHIGLYVPSAIVGTDMIRKANESFNTIPVQGVIFSASILMLILSAMRIMAIAQK
jgi:hypothetical protein